MPFCIVNIESQQTYLTQVQAALRRAGDILKVSSVQISLPATCSSKRGPKPVQMLARNVLRQKSTPVA